eukprot:scaffold380850_cov37-Prasinocladus_malaysianus.AAC.1
MDTMGNPLDDNGHGTHCAGTIGAVGGNNLGVIGVHPNVSIMACKFLDADGSGHVSGAIACLEYALDNQAHITSNSYGGIGNSMAMAALLEVAEARGQPFVTAAGNSHVDNDIAPAYPASFTNNIVTSVASTDKEDRLSFFSNWGRDSVDLAAPGTSILSTAPSNSYVRLSGTSMATPHVAGAYALI